MILPDRSPFISRLFLNYTRFYLRRSFHAVHLLGAIPQIPQTENIPLLVALNHVSWWDVLVGLLAAERIGGEWYAVMDERQLRRYRFFTKLGMIGVDRTSLRGAKEFLDYTETLLQNSSRALWLTPQGEMLSSHSRPLRFQPGLSHLAERLQTFYFLPVALHYEFWNEPKPEAFFSFGSLERFSLTDSFDRKAFRHTCESRLETHLDTLLAAAQKRDATLFTPLLVGKGGISTVYDTMRSVSSRLRGERFHAAHSDLETPQWKRRD